MEVLNWIITCFLSFMTIILFAMVKRWRRKQNSNELPPGPRKLPLIGNLHNLIGSLLHHVLRDLARKHGALIHLQLGEIKAIVVSSSRLAKEITETHDLAFANRPDFVVSKIMSYNGLDIITSPYGEYWRESRRVCVQQLLSPKKVATFRTIREEEFGHLISDISKQNGKPVDLTWIILSSTVKMVSRAMFGKVCRDHDTLLYIINEFFQAEFDLADLFPSYKILHVLSGTRGKMLKLRHKVDLIMEEMMINEHKLDNSEKVHLTDILLRIRDNGGLRIPIGNDNVKAILFDMFAAGSHTSATTVVWAMSELMKNPHVMEKAKKEIHQAFKRKKTINEEDIQCLKYLKLVIKETLRLHPPAPLLIPRQCREESEVDGYKIPLGTMVLINAWAIARDPKYWNDAESFIPERFENSPIDFTSHHYEYIPFGAGRRRCPGNSFGLANVELPLALLLFHFDWTLPNGINFKDLDMTEVAGLIASRKTHLYLVAKSG